MLSIPLLAAPAWAQDEDDEFDEDLADEELLEDEGVDDRDTFEGFKKDLAGESPSEEIDAWYRYLEAYPGSMFRLEKQIRHSEKQITGTLGVVHLLLERLADEEEDVRPLALL